MAEGNTSKAPTILRWIFGLVGGIFLLAGGVITAFSYDFVSNSLPTTGTVVAVDVITSDDGVSYRPTVRYLDHTGQKRRGETFLASSSYDYDIGTRVDILYDMRDSSSIRMDTWFEVWGFGVLFAGIGVVITMVVIFVGGKGRKIAPPAMPRLAKPRKRPKAVPAPEGYHITPEYLETRETAEDHARETDYTPVVRRRRR